MKSILYYANLITVEPIGFLTFAGLILYALAQSALTYNAVCIQKFHTNISVDCFDLRATPWAEKYSQKQTARWSMYLTLTHLIPVITADIIFGAWGDRVGRKGNIMLGISGVLITMTSHSWLAYNLLLPLYWLLPFSFVAGATGFIALVPMSCYAYLVDITVDKDLYTTRMVIFSATTMSSAIIGALLTAALTYKLPLLWVLFSGQMVVSSAWVYTVLRIKQVPPAIMKQRCVAQARSRGQLVNQVSTESTAELIPEPLETTRSSHGLLHTVYDLIKEAVRTFIKPREGRKRLYIVISALLYFVLTCVEFAQPTKLFVFGGPFYWKPYFLAIYTAAAGMITVVGQVVGMVVFKRLLKFHETTIVLIAVGSFTCHLIVIGLAKTTWMVFLASAVNLFGGLAIPTVKAFIAQLVPPDEVGKSFTIFGISTDLSFILGSTIFNNVYYATVDFFPGLTFLIMACIAFLCFLGFLWIAFTVRRDRTLLIGQQNSIN